MLLARCAVCLPLTISAFVVAVASADVGQGPEAPSEKVSNDTLKATAVTIVERLNKGEFANVVADFDPAFKTVMPVEKLRDAWAGPPFLRYNAVKENSQYRR